MAQAKEKVIISKDECWNAFLELARNPASITAGKVGTWRCLLKSRLNYPAPRRYFQQHSTIGCSAVAGHSKRKTWSTKTTREFKMECWLCPSLFKYFERAPKKIFVK